MKKSFLKQSRGIILSEMIVYIAIMTVISLIIIQIIVGVVKSNKESFVLNNIRNSASSVLEKVVREVRLANSINYSDSILNSSSGSISLLGKDVDGNPRTVKIYLDGQSVKVDENGTYAGPLSSSGTQVLSLKFIPIVTANSNAVKTELSIQGGSDVYLRNANFYSTTILRGSY